MIKCSECGASQHEGALFCSECGRSLLVTPQKSSAPLPFYERPYQPSPPVMARSTVEPAGGARKITFVAPGSRRRFTLQLIDQIHVGRYDPETGVSPELDLAQAYGDEQGVSRMHALIQNSGQHVMLIDLNSTNGTWLNNYRLPAEQPYLLKSGDEVRFGDLLIHIFFD
jgi:hypothetical protein